MTRTTLSLIAGVARNGAIGNNNELLFRLPEDMRHFKRSTLGCPVIMGRKTWDSLGRPLPGRLNLVVSRQPGLQLEGAEVFASLDAAIERAEHWAREQGAGELMLIGGAQLYAQALERADRLYLTRVGLRLEGDAWFPEFSEAEWSREAHEEHPATADTPAYDFETWVRR